MSWPYDGVAVPDLWWLGCRDQMMVWRFLIFSGSGVVTNSWSLDDDGFSYLVICRECLKARMFSSSR